MNARINELMARGRTQVLEPQVRSLEELHSTAYGNSEGGTLGAYNKTPVQDELDGYLLDIIAGLTQHHGATKEEALDYVYDCADELAEDGQLPEMPEDDSPDEDIVAWMNAAKSTGFAQYVADMAVEEANEAPEAE